MILRMIVLIPSSISKPMFQLLQNKLSLDHPRLASRSEAFEDITSIQYPSLSKEEALSRVVWASIVMLPDVNGMMWKEAKRMAFDVEVKRVCIKTRIAARVRRNIQRALYLKAKHSATFISKHVRSS